MSPPLAYARECGPIAVAAVARISPEEAAQVIWPHRALWHGAARPNPSASGVLGTPVEAMGDVLLRLGIPVEWWSADGRLVADQDLYASLLRQWVERRALEVFRVSSAELNEAGSEEPTDSESGSLPTLETWLQDRTGGGFWLPVVVQGERAHVLACYGPNVLAGGPLEAYSDWTVATVLRAFPSKGDLR